MSVLRKFSVALKHNDRKKADSHDGTTISPASSNGTSTPTSGNRRSLASIFHHFDRRDYSSGTDDSDTDSEFAEDGLSKNAAARAAKKAAKKEKKARMSIESGRDESFEKLQQRLELAREHETDDMRARYGELPMSQSLTRATENRVDIDLLNPNMVGHEVLFRARVHHHRNMGQKLVFIMFRQRISTIQGVLVEEPGIVGPLMIHWSEHVRTGSIMRVRGIVQRPTVTIKSASIHNLEIKITHLHTIARRAEPGA